MRRGLQSLTVVNTVANAIDLFKALDDPDAFHLSTRLCAAHRRDVLQEIRRRLKAGEPCRVISTQVVEAGVDLDFPLVLRSLGPLDRIVQAAGRCNREGRLDRGRVVIFEPEEGGLPSGAYRTATDETRIMIKDGALDLTNPDTFPAYFAGINSLLGGDREAIQGFRATWSFEQVARKFQMIPDDTASVVVRYPGSLFHAIVSSQSLIGEVDRIINGLKRASFSGGATPRSLLRAAQPFIVAVRRTEMPRQIEAGLAIELLDGLYEWKGGYHDKLGLSDQRIDPTNLYLSA